MKPDIKKHLNIWNLFTITILAVFVFFIIYPLILVLYKSVIHPETGKFTLDYFEKFFKRKFYWITLINSFKVTTVSTIFTVIIGLPIAYIMRNIRIRGARTIEILIIICYLSPPFIGAYAWVQLLGRNGVVTQFLNTALNLNLNGIYGFKGIVLVFSLQSFPLVYMYISGALKNMDRSLIEAAESLGCTGIKRFFKIVIPLVMPTMLASGLLVFMRVIADFGTPMLIGEGFKTMPVLIYSQFMGEVTGDDGFAAALCIIIMAVTTFLFFVQRYIARHSTYAMTALNPIIEKEPSGIGGLLAHIFVYTIVFLAALPQIVVIVTSFLKSKGGQVFTWGFSLDSYRATLLAKDNSIIPNTYKLGLAAMGIIIVFGIIIPYLTERKKNPFTDFLDTIAMFPFIIPGSVLGISYLFAFGQKPLLLSGTAFIMIISFAMRRMPYTIRSSTAIIGQISPSLEEAAISLGASEMGAFTKIIMPLMMPGVIAGAIMSWITVISELSSSIILYTTRTQTLTVSIYTEVVRGNYGNAAAYSTVLTVTSIISLFLFFKLTNRHETNIW